MVGKLLAFYIFFLQLLGPISTILCPAKIWSNADFAPQSYGAIQILPRKFMKPSFFAQQNYGAIQNLPSKIMEKCKLSLRNHRAIFSEANITTKFFLKNIFRKSLIFQKYVHPFNFSRIKYFVRRYL